MTLQDTIEELDQRGIPYNRSKQGTVNCEYKGHRLTVKVKNGQVTKVLSRTTGKGLSPTRSCSNIRHALHVIDEPEERKPARSGGDSYSFDCIAPLLILASLHRMR